MRSLNAGGLSEHSTLSELSEHAKKLESVSRRGPGPVFESVTAGVTRNQVLVASIFTNVA
jgi:hypothetical protein